MHVVRLLPIVRNFHVRKLEGQPIWEHCCVLYGIARAGMQVAGEVNRCGADRVTEGVDFNFTTRIPARTSYLLTHLVHQQQLTVICGADSLPQLTPWRPYDVRNRAAAHRKR
jgi:hypothetical protein